MENGTTDGQELKADLSNYKPSAFNDPSVTVDVCICRYVNKRIEVLLIKRGKEPFKDMWAIPGGFLNIPRKDSFEGQETLEEAAKRELKEETNMDGVFIEQLKTYGDPDRDPRKRIITAVYYALLDSKELEKNNIQAGDDAKEVGWFPLNNPGVDLAFDHSKILKDLFDRLAGKVTYVPLAFKLLPEKFTWGDLKAIYEYLLNKPILEPNFRRKMKSMYIINTIEEMVKPKTGRPAKMLTFGGVINDIF